MLQYGNANNEDMDMAEKKNAVFLAVIDHIIKLEGGLTVDPVDPGNWSNGKLVGTKYGISSKAYPNVDLNKLTEAQAAEIYYEDYWMGNNCFIYPNPMIMALMLDMSINHGCRNANQILQRAVGVDDDGIVGKKTMAAVVRHGGSRLFTMLVNERIKFYTKLSLFNRYGRGWMRRATSMVDHILKAKL
jgi:lysozyme family protein